MNDELKQIKKIYGEEMMHLCRELFPTLLETQGKLLKILKKYIAPTRFLVDQIKKMHFEGEFKAWIYDHAIDEKDKKPVTDKSPFELMEEAGYTLYECHNEDEIDAFKHFYKSGEELCTFRGGRLERCIVFFAVKKNVDKIKRENFSHPEREDEYGTSVISIQFSRDHYCTVSIKNRYNHTVKNPDSTFSNNLEKIIPGLTNSFEKYCGIKLHQSINDSEFLTAMRYIQASNGKYYYCNIDINEVYFCENNIIILRNKVIDQYAENKERYVLIDQYIVDLKDKKIFNPIDDIDDSFVKSIYDVGEISNIGISKNGDNRIININYQNGEKVEIEINKHNSIIGYKNVHIKEIGNGFLSYNSGVMNISLPETRKIGDGFVSTSDVVKDVSLDNVEEIGDVFLMRGGSLKEINLPNVRKIGHSFMSAARNLASISLPKVEKIKDGFLFSNRGLESIELPKVKEIGSKFLRSNLSISSVSFPKVEVIEDLFLASDANLSEIDLPKIREIGNQFLRDNEKITKIFFPEVEIIGDRFLEINQCIKEITLPELKKVGEHFLEGNKSLKKAYFPKLASVGYGFLPYHDLFRREATVRRMTTIQNREVSNRRFRT